MYNINKILCKALNLLCLNIIELIHRSGFGRQLANPVTVLRNDGVLEYWNDDLSARELYAKWILQNILLDKPTT